MSTRTKTLFPSSSTSSIVSILGIGVQFGPTLHQLYALRRKNQGQWAPTFRGQVPSRKVRNPRVEVRYDSHKILVLLVRVFAYHLPPSSLKMPEVGHMLIYGR